MRSKHYIQLGCCVVIVGSLASLSTQSFGEQSTVECKYRASGALPDPHCTPGATNRHVTQTNIHKTICVVGWSDSQRPSVRVTEPEKLISMRQYGYRFGTSPANYEYDHLIPLELGGASNDTRNMFPEPHNVVLSGVQQGSYTKDVIENKLHRLVCADKMRLSTARTIMRTDWRKGE